MKPTLALLSLVALTAACSGDSPDEDAKDAVAAAIPVETTAAIRGDIVETYSGTAAIEAFADAEVIAKVGGEVRQIMVEEGDDVSAGQVLAVLDGDRLRLRVAETEAQLRKLKRDYQRHLDLKEKSLISAGDFEKIQYEMEALEASHNLAVLELSYTEIRAPIAGVISERFIKTGNTLDVNTKAFKVTTLEPLISYLHVPEREYRRLKPGQTAALEVDAVPNTRFEGSVARVSPIVDAATGTFKLTIEVSDPTRRLKPGMFARIGIVADRRANALQVPRAALVEEDDLTSVFVASGDTVEKRPIETGYSSSGLVEITAGLGDDEEVVVVGQSALKDGAKIVVVGSASSGPSARAANVAK